MSLSLRINKTQIQEPLSELAGRLGTEGTCVEDLTQDSDKIPAAILAIVKGP